MSLVLYSETLEGYWHQWGGQKYSPSHCYTDSRPERWDPLREIRKSSIERGLPHIPRHYSWVDPDDTVQVKSQLWLFSPGGSIKRTSDTYHGCGRRWLQ